MNKKSLVLVVGAGASKEAGLPLGGELTAKIAKVLRLMPGSMMVEDQIIRSVVPNIQSKLNTANSSDGERIFEYFSRISKAMPIAASIDNFIHQTREIPSISLCAKVAIARCILEAESKTNLMVNPGDVNSQIDLDSLSSTWYKGLFQVLTENCQWDDLCGRFNQVSIVCFNYDRCIEQYLYYALQIFYGKNGAEVSEVLTCLDIFHPYGTVGVLPWQSQKTQSCEFGVMPIPSILLKLAESIRTFTEGMSAHSSTDILKIRNSIEATDRLVFIGFSFHKLNMKLLFDDLSEHKLGGAKVLGTAYKVSLSNWQSVINELQARINNPGEINRDVTCAQFFSDYSRELSLD